MKPRRNSAPMTAEDADIWFNLYPGKRESECVRRIRAELESDRRDADLIFYAQFRPHWPTAPYTDPDGCLNAHMVRGVLTALTHFRKFNPL